MVDRVMALPEGTRPTCSPRWCAGARANTGKRAGRMAEGRLHPRADRRRDLRDRGRPGARQEVQARHRSGGRPDRGEATGSRRGWPTASSRRCKLAEGLAYVDLADGVVPGREDEEARGRQPEGRRPAAQPHRVLREVRLPGQRLHDRGDRAAAVQLQRAAGRLPGVRRAGREAAVRSAAGGAERERSRLKQGAVVPWAKSNPPSPYYMQVLASLAKAYDFDLTTPWNELEPDQRDDHPPRHRRAAGRAHLQGRAQGIHRQQGVRRGDRQPQPPPAADRQRVDARGTDRASRPRSRARPATASGSTRRRSAVKVAGEDIATPVRVQRHQCEGRGSSRCPSS